VGRECPEWLKPMATTQYLGSVAHGLCFFHIDVVEEENRAGYLKFLDNCAILTGEEGVIEEKEIVESLGKLFDSNCIGRWENWKSLSSWLDFLHINKLHRLLSLM
jgi:hypothetical protein